MSTFQLQIKTITQFKLNSCAAIVHTIVVKDTWKQR